MAEIETRLEHILIRFSTGAAHQKQKAGEIEGAHMATVECLVDDAGEVLGLTQNEKNGMAQPLDPAMVSTVLGKQFATVAAQLAEAEQISAEAAKAKGAADSRIAELTSALAASQSETETLKAGRQAALAALA